MSHTGSGRGYEAKRALCDDIRRVVHFVTMRSIEYTLLATLSLFWVSRSDAQSLPPVQVETKSEFASITMLTDWKSLQKIRNELTVWLADVNVKGQLSVDGCISPIRLLFIDDIFANMQTLNALFDLIASSSSAFERQRIIEGIYINSVGQANMLLILKEKLAHTSDRSSFFWKCREDETADKATSELDAWIDDAIPVLTKINNDAASLKSRQ